ncbi:MurR/RpiR family transcriptional regulator [Halomonas elongata]|uniref:MurR/RpiR family transcriptional regulator n=1 Tax=Halomonas elongata TaxID=2746 RepID=UPI0023AF23F8|nr:MurR/RpiR family transcriptional regulator [Halomonas elongata]
MPQTSDLALPPDSLEALRTLVDAARRQAAPMRLGARRLALLEGLLAAPEDVTLHSIGSLADEHGVSASTLTRLAHQLGFEGFRDFQRLFQEEMLRSRHFYSEQVRRLAGSDDDDTTSSRLMTQELDNLSRTAEHLDIEALHGAGRELLEASRIYVLGLRGCFGLAHYLGYYLGFLDKPVTTLGGAGFTIAEDLGRIGPDDVLIAIAVKPETRMTVLASELAANRGARVIALANRGDSPLLPFASRHFHACCEGDNFFNPLAALFAVAEALLAEVTAELGEALLPSLRANEAAFQALDIE